MRFIQKLIVSVFTEQCVKCQSIFNYFFLIWTECTKKAFAMSSERRSSQWTFNWLWRFSRTCMHNMICEIIPWERLHLNFRIHFNWIRDWMKTALTIYVVMILLFHIFLSLWFQILLARKKLAFLTFRNSFLRMWIPISWPFANIKSNKRG